MHRLSSASSSAVRRAAAKAAKPALKRGAHKEVKFSNEGRASILKGVDVLANAVSVTAVAPNDVDTVMTQAGGMGEAFTEGWDNADKRADSGYLEISGGMGSDIFGDNNITDADFNFFDDQPGGGDLDFSRAAGETGGTLDLTVPKLPSFEGLPQNPPTKPPVPPPPVPVFAKPELRHARSSMMGNARQANGENRKS